MSYNSNFKSNKCWSCEYYSGKREYKKGTIFSDSVSTDDKGRCACKRSSNFDKKVSDNNWCSKYQKWGVLESALALEEQKREAKKIEAEQREQARRIEEENERQRREIERENRRLERERYLASLSPEEREAFLKKEQEEAEAMRLAAELLRKERILTDKKRELEACKKPPIKALIIGSIISIAAFILGWSPYWYFNSALKDIIREIEYCESQGIDPSSARVQYLYQQGLAVKSARNGVVWIPFVILVIGIVITIIVFMTKKKNRGVRATQLKKEIEELSK